MSDNSIQTPYSSFKGTKGKGGFIGNHHLKELSLENQAFLKILDSEAKELIRDFEEKNKLYKSKLRMTYLDIGGTNYEQMRWEMISLISGKRKRIIKPLFFENILDARQSHRAGEEIHIYLQNNPIISDFISNYEVQRLNINWHLATLHKFELHLRDAQKVIQLTRKNNI